MGNIKSIISSHNRKLLEKTKSSNNDGGRKCNCAKNKICPLDKKCLEKNLIYKATVKYDDDNKIQEYVGSTGNTFKIRYNGHKNSFEKETRKNSTELSKFIWKLKTEDKKYEIKWSILHKLRAIKTSKGCALCNLERFELARAIKERTLNKRSELQAKCPHEKGNFFPPLPKQTAAASLHGVRTRGGGRAIKFTRGSCKKQSSGQKSWMNAHRLPTCHLAADAEKLTASAEFI